MIAVPSLWFLLNLIIWGAILRLYEIKLHDSTSPFGSLARALQVVY